MFSFGKLVNKQKSGRQLAKRLNFLHYILSENITSTLRQVYDTMKFDSRKGDFCQLVNQDMEDLDMIMTEEEIRSFTKGKWKMTISKKLKEFVFAKLVDENSKQENTKHILFEELKLSKYLHDNRNQSLSKIIFSVRSKTLDLKHCNPGNILITSVSFVKKRLKLFYIS